MSEHAVAMITALFTASATALASAALLAARNKIKCERDREVAQQQLLQLYLIRMIRAQ
jgi:hypothetical protein